LATKTARLMLDARRKAGETIRIMKERGELDCGMGGNRRSQSHAGTVKLDDLGLTKNQSSRYQQEASVPEEVYRDWVEAIVESDARELTAAGFFQLRPIGPRALLVAAGFKRSRRPTKATASNRRHAALGIAPKSRRRAKFLQT
jgi:hypothetical protein